MENTPEFEGDGTSEVLNEPFPAAEAGEGDQEVSSQRPPEFITSRQAKREAQVWQTVGEDGSVHKEANVRHKVGKDGKDRKQGKDGEAEQEKGSHSLESIKGKDGEAKQEKGGHGIESINSTILVSVAVVAVVGAIIAKLALARKLR